jgi:hypothetical protein
MNKSGNFFQDEIYFKNIEANIKCYDNKGMILVNNLFCLCFVTSEIYQ